MEKHNRRWYDKHDKIQETFELLKTLQDRETDILTSEINEMANSIKSYKSENDMLPLSLGWKRVMGLYQTGNSRRWYDKKSKLKRTINLISTLPENDFYDIIDGLYITLK